jgi:hypothetical protein
MTPEEIGGLVALASSNFPHLQKENMGPSVILWNKMLADLPYVLAEAAVCQVLATSKYWPNIAEIRESALFITGNKAPTALEAWGMVREAIRKDKPASTLPPAVQKAIKAFGGLDGIGYSEDLKYIQGQFLRAYDELATKENHYEELPAQVRELISEAGVKRIGGKVDEI